MDFSQPTNIPLGGNFAVGMAYSTVLFLTYLKNNPFHLIATLHFRGDFPYVSIQGGAPYLSKLFLFDIND